MKNSIKLLAMATFVSTLFLNLSFDSYGHFKFISQAHAESQKWKQLSATCPDNKTHIIVCGAGSDASCTPSGSCGG